MKTRLRDIISWCVDASSVTSVADHEVSTTAMGNWILLRSRWIASLVRCSKLEEPVIPPLKWRNRHGRRVLIGWEGAEALCQSLMQQLKSGGADGATTTERRLTLDLHGLHIEDDGVRALLPFLIRDDHLVALLLPGNDITDEGVTALSIALTERSKPLERLSLIDNPVTARGVLCLTSFCCNSAHMPKELMLCRVERQEGGGQDGSSLSLLKDMEDKLIHMLHSDSNGRLKSFTYHGSGCNDFSVAGFKSILHAVFSRSSLEHLALHDCYNCLAIEKTNELLMDSMIAPFTVAADGLRSAESALRSLELHIPLNEEAVGALAKGISASTHLSKLNLRACEMSLESLQIIGNALSTNTTLISLDISYQCADIAYPLCDNRWMNWVSRGQTKSNVSSSRRPLLPVFKSLHNNKTLQDLTALGIDVVNDDVEELCACIERSGNNTIRHVYHTDVGSMPLTTKLNSLLAQNRCSSHNKPPRANHRKTHFADSAAPSSPLPPLLTSTRPAFGSTAPRGCQFREKQERRMDIKPLRKKQALTLLSIVSPVEEHITSRINVSNDFSNSTRNFITPSPPEEESPPPLQPFPDGTA